MRIQDHSGVTHSSTLLAKGSEISSESGGQILTGDDHAPKIRKPYTISKQRERWTEEEHDKFLEALKLYGRAWKKIEEHVGTKSAVQIRSHAQKFFSKVVRESSNSDSSSIKTVEIPPPRPKRKPTHPYPRKSVPSAKKERRVEEQSARSTSLNSTVDQENRSPTSVLCGDSNTPDGSSSPTSCIDDASGQENMSKFDEPISTKAELNPNVNAFDKVGSVEATTTKSLKLFGKTLSLPDLEKPATSSPCSIKSKSSDPAVVKAENSSSQLWDVDPSALLPRWAFYGGVPFQFIPQYIVNDTKFDIQDKETEKEGSSSDNCYKTLGAETQSQSIPSANISSRSEMNTRGFVPYKRSSFKRETRSSTLNCEEKDLQEIHLCL